MTKFLIGFLTGLIFLSMIALATPSKAVEGFGGNKVETVETTCELHSRFDQSVIDSQQIGKDPMNKVYIVSDPDQVVALAEADHAFRDAPPITDEQRESISKKKVIIVIFGKSAQVGKIFVYVDDCSLGMFDIDPNFVNDFFGREANAS